MQAEGPVRTILFLHRGGDQIRGSEVALLTLLDELDRRRYRPVVAFSNPIMAAPLEARGVRGALVEMPEILVTRGEIRLPLLGYRRALREIAALVQATQAALIVCNGGGPNQIGLPVSKRLRVPLLTYMHHPASRSYLRNWLLPRTHGLAFASQYTEAHTRALIGRGGPVVYPGVIRENERRGNTPNIALRATFGVPSGATTFVQVGALVPHKDHATLLRAFAQIPEHVESHLLIIGTGPELARLEQLAKELGVARRVTFTGRVQNTDLIFREVADVNVLASIEEGLGLVNIEAAEWAIPSIATDCTGIRETIINDQTGLLFAPGDSGALAAAMRQLALDPARRGALGAAARTLAHERFGRRKFASGFEQLFDRVIADGPHEATV
jgi:glycosyltransferase involved in cell wall biosynthesis